MNRREFVGASLLAASLPAWAKPAEQAPGTWSVRRFPANGKGLFHPLKHVRCAVHPENQRIYFCGGDFAGPVYMQSGRQEIYSYDIEQDGWQAEHAYCPAPGETVPYHPDQVGWVWDAKRKLFWMLPGVQYGSSTNGPPCDGKRGVVMGFDPRTRKWTEPQQGPGFRREYEPSKFAVYDEKTDACIMLGNGEVSHWHPETGQWDGVRFGGNRILFGSYTAQVDREIYALDFRAKALARYQIDKRRMEDGPKLPFDPGANEMTNLVYAAPHGKIFLAKFAYGAYHEPLLWAYDVKTQAFEERAVQIADVAQPRANTMVYHEASDRIMLLGNLVTEPIDQRFFLYRP
jgi:hypothetical protein